MDVDADTQATETQATSRSTTEPSKEGGIPQELLRKYILWAREHTAPKLGNMDEDKIARLFADMRRESLATGAYPITVRFYPPPLLLIMWRPTLLTHNTSRFVTWRPSFA